MRQTIIAILNNNENTINKLILYPMEDQIK